MSWDTHAGSAPWMDRLSRSTGVAVVAEGLAPGDRLRVSTAVLRAAGMVDADSVDEESVAAEVALMQQLLESRSTVIDANDRLVAADALQEYALTTSSAELFERTVAAVTPWLSDRTLTSWARCHWLISFGTVSGRRYPYRRAGFPYPNAEAALHEAWMTSQREELPNLRFAATMAQINVARALGDYAAAETLVARLGQECNPAHPIQVVNRMNQLAAQLAYHGRYADALVAEGSALEAARQAQAPVDELWNEWLTLAQLLIGAGRCDEAHALTDEHAHKFSGLFQQVMRVVGDSALLWAARSDRSPSYVERLRACAAAVREMGWANYMTCIPQVVAVLWADALEHGIEREFIVAAIRRRRLAAPALYVPAWPWRLRVRLLGGFAIERDDVPVALGPKAPMKPIELLKLLAAAPQHKADVQQLFGWLWPATPPAAAKAALDVALFRLRKLLGVDAAVVLSAGKVQLVASHVWVDAAAFEAWQDDALRQLDTRARSPAAGALAERLFADYQGPLFGDDVPTAWSIAPRERLHGKFLELVGGLGRFYEAGGEWANARRIYDRGLARDPLAEEFHRGLIRCELAVGEPAAALHAYRRCREVLSVVLGISPSPATLALVSKVRGFGA